MPTLVCPDLGQLDFQNEEILSFPEGLPAFESLKSFLLAQKPEYAPFAFLISVDSPTVRFICVPVATVDPEYSFEILAGEGSAVGLEDGEYSAVAQNPRLLAIVTLPDSGEATANLASPVVVDLQRNLGVQVILTGSPYSVVTPLQRHSSLEEAC